MYVSRGNNNSALLAINIFRHPIFKHTYSAVTLMYDNWTSGVLSSFLACYDDHRGLKNPSSCTQMQPTLKLRRLLLLLVQIDFRASRQCKHALTNQTSRVGRWYHTSSGASVHRISVPTNHDLGFSRPLCTIQLFPSIRHV